MEVVTPEFVKSKKVLLRFDLDVLENGVINDPFRLRAGLPTLNLCLENAAVVIMMGHIGRPSGQEVSELSVAPIYRWLANHGFSDSLNKEKLKLLENLRFERGEDEASVDYAKMLASFGEVFVNEAFASYHKAASTTVLPTLLPSAAGLNFNKEVKVLKEVRENPKKPLVVILGGAKVEDKLPAVEAMAEQADVVLVGGKLASGIDSLKVYVDRHKNVNVGELNEGGTDMREETIKSWGEIINGASMIVWNGPISKTDGGQNKGTLALAKMLLQSRADLVVGGGDTVGFLGRNGLLDQFLKKGLPAGRQVHVSTGGGAMLKFFVDGTLPSIEALQ